MLCAGKNGLMRLQFNKLGYEIYEKEQSRRVPAVRAKPGNPGYGFRRARWRDPIHDPQDARVCESSLMGLGVSVERIDRVKKRVHDFLFEWDQVRRPSRPAGPGRPRVPKRGILYDLDPIAEGLDLHSSMVAVDIEGHDMYNGATMRAAGGHWGTPMSAMPGVGPGMAQHGMMRERMPREATEWDAQHHGDATSMRTPN